MCSRSDLVVYGGVVEWWCGKVVELWSGGALHWWLKSWLHASTVSPPVLKEKLLLYEVVLLHPQQKHTNSTQLKHKAHPLYQSMEAEYA